MPGQCVLMRHEMAVITYDYRTRKRAVRKSTAAIGQPFSEYRDAAVIARTVRIVQERLLEIDVLANVLSTLIERHINNRSALAHINRLAVLDVAVDSGRQHDLHRAAVEPDLARARAALRRLDAGRAQRRAAVEMEKRSRSSRLRRALIAKIHQLLRAEQSAIERNGRRTVGHALATGRGSGTLQHIAGDRTAVERNRVADRRSRRDVVRVEILGYFKISAIDQNRGVAFLGRLLQTHLEVVGHMERTAVQRHLRLKKTGLLVGLRQLAHLHRRLVENRHVAAILRVRPNLHTFRIATLIAGVDEESGDRHSTGTVHDHTLVNQSLGRLVGHRQRRRRTIIRYVENRHADAIARIHAETAVLRERDKRILRGDWHGDER